ncbi:MAG TPA: universal stress protein [Nitrospiraceae bacterium]|nr:universal stress protein [Nitrospiraceae bacterium]
MPNCEAETMCPLINTVVLASDLSEETGSAQRYAVSLAGTFRAELRIVYVAPVQPMVFPGELTMALYHDRFRMEIDRQLQALLRGIREEGIRANAVQFMGKPGKTILEAVRKFRADLLVLGSHPRRPHQYALTAGIVDHVVRSAPCPVLTVPSAFGDAALPGSMCVRRLVVVVDWSESALIACEYASELAQRHRAAVTILVVTCATNATGPASDVDAIADAMRSAGLQVEIRIATGDPSHAIVAYARGHGCDCVVIGLPAYGADGAGDHPVQQILAQAVCPVMIVKSPKFPSGYRPAASDVRVEETGSAAGRETDGERDTTVGGMPCTIRTER